MKILVVEDDQFLDKSYKIALEQNGLDVDIAGDGEAALAYLQKTTPDLIVLDLLIPKLLGLDVLEKIRENETLKSIPVIILTNLDDSESKERAQALGVQEYIIKTDVNLDTLVPLIIKYLQ